jgi:RES domain-containing protein
VVYASENRALAVLESLVHMRVNRVPDDLMMMEIEIPDGLAEDTWREIDLPPGWREIGSEDTLDRGDAWLEQRTAAILWIPSAILPSESNAILNPLHDDHRRIRIKYRSEFRFDPRLLNIGTVEGPRR